MKAPRIDQVVVARIEAFSEPNPETGCLEWQRATQRGYGKITVDGHAYRAHRLMCEWENGPAPEGKPLALHTCNNKACVRGGHLYWGDYRDNTLDCMADGTFFTPFLKVTVCIRGHEFNPENTYCVTRKGGKVERKCRECNRIRNREWQRAKRQAVA